MFAKQEYDTELLRDQRRDEDEHVVRDRDLDNAFVRWKRIAQSLIVAVSVVSVMELVTFGAACFFAYKWYTVAPMPIVFSYDAEGELMSAQVGWPEQNPTVQKTKAGLITMFKRIRRVSFDPSITAEQLNQVPQFLTARAQNMLAAFNDAHPLEKFYENKVVRRTYGHDFKQDPNTPSLFYGRWKEELTNANGALVKPVVEVTTTVWTVPGATCPLTVEQVTANPNCVVVDSFEWNALN